MGEHDWTLELELHEVDGRTRADVVLMTPSGRHHGWGRARLAPGDRDVPVVGEELAVARALHDLARQLLVVAGEEIEALTGEHVELR